MADVVIEALVTVPKLPRSPRSATLDCEVTRLVDAYQAEVIDLTELVERRRRIDDHGRMLRERVREIAQQRSEQSAELRLLEEVDAFCTSMREAMEEPSFTVQQKVLQSQTGLWWRTIR